jgi:hypothetical protein
MYRIADIITLSRIIISIGLAAIPMNATWAVILIALGLLTDAVDGPFARAWPWPEYEPKPIWKRLSEGYDMLADTSLVVAQGVVIFRLLPHIFWPIITIGVIGTALLFGPTILLCAKGHKGLATVFATLFRWFSVGGQTVILAILVTSIGFLRPAIVTVITFAAFIAIAILKRDRLIDDKRN